MPENPEIIAALLRQRTAVSFRAGGPSMNPTIRDGELVTIQPRPPGRILQGSVVLYGVCERLALHRIVTGEKRTGRVFAVGDAAVDGGDWIPAADVIGIAASVRRDGRCRRLGTRRARWAGMLRYALRPLRRAFWNFRQTPHAQTPARGDS